MKAAQRFTSIVGTLLFIALIGLVFFGYQAIQRNVEALQTAGQEDISWSTSQLELELMRFRAELAALHSNELTGNESAANLNNRFDILWSRVAIFQRGRIGERLQDYDAENQIVSRFFAAMQAFETQVVLLQPGDDTAIRAIDRGFAPFSNELRELSRIVTQGEQKRLSELRGELGVGVQNTAILLGAATAVLLLALIVNWNASRRFRKMAQHNLQLAREAEQASRAKSQFLTMMSHELRTPMNGVLGLLAIARQQDLPGKLSRTLSMAERSARRMIGLLTDILDFSAIQSRSLTVERKQFSLRMLAKGLGEAIDESRGRLDIAVDENAPDQLLGDARRLHQIFEHLCNYLLETAGVDHLSVTMTHADGALQGTIVFSYRQGGGDSWRPIFLEDAAPQDDTNFAAGAVGPTLARGLSAQMGGRIDVHKLDDGGTKLAISIPMSTTTAAPFNVHMQLQSGAVRAICESVLRDERILVNDDVSTAPPKLILFEPTGPDETKTASDLRNAYPKVPIISIGRVTDKTLYDQCLDLPLDLSALRLALQKYRNAA
ncbi:MAG: histidine kinase dimerization/phospho-acceptor domain-containing protein [Paracoccaceae bacterium]